MQTGTLVGETAWAECESAIRAFETAWRVRGDAPPNLGVFAAADVPHPTRLLVELVHIDLEFRLRAGEDARAEDYLARFPALRAPDLAVDLLAAEYALRNRHRPPARPEEFCARFPEFAGEFRARVARAGLPGGGSSATRAGGDAGGQPVGPPVIPGYEILGELGRGGMGVVFKARDRLLNRTVAVKTFAAVPRADGCARFAREAEAIARLDHPHIVPVYEVGDWPAAADGPAVPFFVMKWYPGGSLEGAPAGPGTDPAAHARAVETIARAVHHAHQRGVLHRDLKPSNILLDEAGRPHVADFGLAARVDPSDHPTLTAVVAGTPAYMAPEQATNPKQVSTAADVYGLGAVLFNRLTGKTPFTGATPLATLERVATAAPERPSAVNPAVPRDLDTICLKCLEKEPARRYATAQELADDLERWRLGLPIAARPTPAWEHAYRRVRRHPVVSALCATTLASLVAAVVVLADGNARISAKEAEVRAAYLRECAMRYKLQDALAHEQRSLYLVRVAAAGQLYAAGQPPQAGALLDQCPEAARGWEWRYLDSLRKGSAPTRTLAEVGGGAGGLAVAPDGKRVAVTVPGPADPRVVVLDAATGRELHRFAGATGAAFHPITGQVVVVRAGELTLCYPDTGAGVWRRPLPSTSTSALRPTFSADGSRLATPDPAGGVQLWNPADGTPAGRLDTGAAPVQALAFFPDGTRLAVATADTLAVWNVAANTRLPWGDGAKGAAALAVSADGRWLAAADPDRGVQLYEVTTGQVVRSLAGNPTRVTALAFSPDGNRLVTGGADEAVRVWDVESGQEVLALPGAGGPVAAVAWDRAGDAVYALDDALRVWGRAR
jgi:WD40 repeat protein